MPSPLSVGFPSLSPGFSCHLDPSDPLVYTSSLDLSAETRISHGHFHLAQTHRSKMDPVLLPGKPIHPPVSPNPEKVVRVIPDSSFLLVSIASK